MDAFQILGVERQGATLETVKKAWKNLSLIHHPDKNPHNQEEAHNIMIRINSAYQIACDILDREARNNHQLIRPNTSTHMPEETNSHQPGHSTNSSPMPEAHQPNPSGSIPRSPEATKPETLYLIHSLGTQIDQELRAFVASIEYPSTLESWLIYLPSQQFPEYPQGLLNALFAVSHQIRLDWHSACGGSRFAWHLTWAKWYRPPRYQWEAEEFFRNAFQIIERVKILKEALAVLKQILSEAKNAFDGNRQWIHQFWNANIHRWNEVHNWLVVQATSCSPEAYKATEQNYAIARSAFSWFLVAAGFQRERLNRGY